MVCSKAQPAQALVDSGDGALLATAQEGKHALIRLWDYANGSCLAILCAHASSVTALDISGDGQALLGVGLDLHSKQQIVLWNIADVRTSRRAEVILKATTEYNVKRAKFSPFEPDKFMTVGRDSIRLYRIKNGALRGLSIQVCACCRCSFSAVHLMGGQ